MSRTPKRENAKRASRPNPREDRNRPYDAKFNPHGFQADAESARVKKKVQLLPRSLAQEDYVDALMDEDVHIVFAMGPAGTGKSLLATLYAIQCLQNKQVDKIIITRPVVSVDEQLGFLPGDLTAKLAPWCIPILDIFKEIYSVSEVEKMILNEVIELAPLGMMRGRTLKNSIVILDEAQNTTDNQMKMMLTRIGEGSKIVVTGDVKQHDRTMEKNGLVDIVNRITQHTDGIAVVKFTRRDIERHPMVDTVLGLYGDN